MNTEALHREDEAKDRGDIISGVEYIESILGNLGEVVLA